VEGDVRTRAGHHHAVDPVEQAIEIDAIPEIGQAERDHAGALTHGVEIGMGVACSIAVGDAHIGGNATMGTVAAFPDAQPVAQPVPQDLRTAAAHGAWPPGKGSRQAGPDVSVRHDRRRPRPDLPRRWVVVTPWPCAAKEK
jgi:hypothetical protein